MKNCKKCGGTMTKMKSGGNVTTVKKMSKGGYAPAQTGGDNVKMGIYGIPNAGTTGPNRSGTYDYKKGGSIVTAVKHSCPPGSVRLPNGKCGTREKFESGGSLKPVNKIQNPGLAKLPTAVRNKMGYMKKGGVKKK